MSRVIVPRYVYPANISEGYLFHKVAPFGFRIGERTDIYQYDMTAGTPPVPYGLHKTKSFNRMSPASSDSDLTPIERAKINILLVEDK